MSRRLYVILILNKLGGPIAAFTAIGADSAKRRSDQLRVEFTQRLGYRPETHTSLYNGIVHDYWVSQKISPSNLHFTSFDV